MEIDHLFLNTIVSGIHPRAFLALLPPKSVKTQQIPVLCLDNMLFSIVTEKSAQICEVVCLGNRR